MTNNNPFNINRELYAFILSLKNMDDSYFDIEANEFSFDVDGTPMEVRREIKKNLACFEQETGCKITTLEVDNSGRNYLFGCDETQAFDYKKALDENFYGYDEYKVNFTFVQTEPRLKPSSIISDENFKHPIGQNADLDSSVCMRIVRNAFEENGLFFHFNDNDPVYDKYVVYANNNIVCRGFDWITLYYHHTRIIEHVKQGVEGLYTIHEKDRYINHNQ